MQRGWVIAILLAIGCGPIEAASPGTTKFELVNVGTTMLYVQASGFSSQGVLGLSTGSGALPFYDTCEICNCGPCPSCAVCGRGLAQVQPLQPGGSWTYNWDQRVFVVKQNGCRAGLDCENPELVVPQSITATATYATSFAVDSTLGAADEYLVDPKSKTQSFRHPAATVRIEIP